MSKLELVDCHSHSAYSGHGSGSIADMVAQASRLGLTTYVQTEHLQLPEGMDPSFDTSMSSETTRRYLAELREQRTMLADRGDPLELVIGIEADWLPGRTQELCELCEPYEYVLGSVHFVDGRPIDDSRDLSAWDELGVDGMWERYLEHWFDMVAHPGPITTFAHPDLPKKYGWMPSFDLADRYADMADAVARSGRMVEMNTAGLRKAVGEMYPASGLLRAFRAAGVECTVGSDAHAPHDIAANVFDAYDLMRQAGYDEVTVPMRDGDRRRIALD